jgi:hypothetical protein
MIQNGNLIRLLLDNTIVAKLLSLNLTLDREMLDKTVKDSSQYKEVQPGNRSWMMDCEGYVVDPYDKNILMFSENLQDSYWTKSGCTISATLYAGPNGEIKANRTSGFASGDYIGKTTTINSLASTAYVFSFYAKTVSSTLNCTAYVGDSSANDTDAITITNSWARYQVTFTSTTGLSPLVVRLTAAATGEIEIFGFQLEQGSVATNYEPTGLKFSDLVAAVQNGTAFTAQFTDQITGDDKYTGTVYLNSISQTASQGQLVTFSCELTGTSSITKSTI